MIIFFYNYKVFTTLFTIKIKANTLLQANPIIIVRKLYLYYLNITNIYILCKLGSLHPTLLKENFALEI